MSTAPAVELDGLSVSYRRRRRLLPVVRDLSLRIEPGEAYGLVGESGCGKTTVAMALMRYLPPNAVVENGAIRFGGEDVLAADQATLRRWRGNRIAMVYQDPGSSLNPTIRVGRQVAEVYETHAGMRRAGALDAAAEMFAKVRFPDPRSMLDRYPHELSGGQQQRVMIAMALAADPELLVLDEPTTGLDSTVEAEVLDLIANLRSELSTAVLFISHNLGIVSRMCDRVGVLYAGRLVEEGDSRGVFRDPRHPYTAALLRCVPRRGMRKDRLRLESIPGYLPAPEEVPKGCPFAPRCPIVKPECETAPPPLAPSDLPDRLSACLRALDVPGIEPGAAASAAPTDASAPPGTTNGSPPGGAPVVTLEGVTKRYRSSGADVTAVDGVSLEIGRGEIFGLVGESGSGKTTLARCIAGLLPTSEGHLEVTSGRGRRAHSRFLQMVFQNPDTALNPRHPVRRILARAQKLQGDPVPSGERRSRLQALARSVRLQDRHLDARPGALSGGLKQRVAIARAFAGTPSVVLCDEPVSALDVSVQAAILNLLVDLQSRRHVAYLFISHDLAVVQYLSDRIGVMYLGELVDVGTADAVFTAPHHPYTEALLSAVPSLDIDGAAPRIKLSGSPASLTEVPSGCRFHTRCPRSLGDTCAKVAPPWHEHDSGNRYRCHILPDELVVLQTRRPAEEAS